MLYGREYWCWPDSVFSCYSKIYKQANYANHLLGLNTEHREGLPGPGISHRLHTSMGYPLASSICPPPLPARKPSWIVLTHMMGMQSRGQNKRSHAVRTRNWTWWLPSQPHLGGEGRRPAKSVSDNLSPKTREAPYAAATAARREVRFRLNW